MQLVLRLCPGQQQADNKILILFDLSHVDLQSICIKDWINSLELFQCLHSVLLLLQLCQKTQKNEEYNTILS